MFILYAVVLGAAAGLLLGGRLSSISELRIRWGGLAVAALLVQVILFSGPVTEAIGPLGPPFYVASTAIVVLVLLRNLALPGLPIVAAGACANLAAIIANGGYMPASPGALAALGKVIGSAYSNSALRTDPLLAPLTDLFALPRWVPFANVFSVGDLLIGVGVAWALVAAMRRPTPAEASASA